MPIFPLFSTEKRADPNKIPAPSDDFWYHLPGLPTSTGVPVSEETALKYLTVFACVSLIAGDVARLPLQMFRKRTDGGSDIVLDHPLQDILHNAPNNEMTSFNWREAAQGHLLLWGNHYSSIVRNPSTGEILELWPLPNPGRVSVRRRGNQLIYEYTVDGKPVTRRRDQIFHIPGYGWNGLYGLSMIQLAREAIGVGVAAEDFGGRYFGAGTHPSGTIEMEGFLGDRREEYQKYLKDGYAGLGKSHALMLLEGGMKYKSMTIPMDDAQFLQTRDHQKVEICGMYHVPPHKIALHGANSNYSNLEQENASYVDSCLIHWVSRWESQISLQLLTPEERMQGLYFKFVLQALLRGDSSSRSDFYNKLFQIGGITSNEIRSLEDMNPIEGGDEAFVMLNLTLLKDAGEPVLPPSQEVDDEEVDDDEEIDGEEVDEEEEARKFFDPKRVLRNLEKRSITARDKLTKAYAPLIHDAAQAIVNRESKIIKQRIANTDNKAAVAVFLDDFYMKFPEYIIKRIGPTLTSYMNATAEEAYSETGTDPIDLDLKIKGYIEGYAERHSRSSRNQMLALLDDEIEALNQRADEWQEKRPDKITRDEGVRASSAVFSMVVFAAGLLLYWRTRGPKTCPYCLELEGNSISSGQTFVKSGDEIDAKGGTGPMKFTGIKTHPPLHQGCDCYVSA